MKGRTYREIVDDNNRKAIELNKTFREMYTEKRYSKWTPEEDEVLRDMSLTSEEKAMKLKRTLFSVNSRMRYLGIRRKESFKRWTDDEVEMILSGTPDEDIAEMTGRSVEAVTMKRLMLRAKGYDVHLVRETHDYSESDDRIIIDNPLPVAARMLGLSYESVKGRRQRLHSMGLLEYTERRKFEDYEIEMLKDESLGNKELSNALDRTEGAIYRKRYLMRKSGEIEW